MSEMAPADIRERIDHPVVDSDGHYWEHWPDLDRYVRDEGISEGLNALWATGTFDGSPHWAGVAPEQRPRVRPFRQTWWGVPFANTDDLAAAMAPSLMYRRLDELGLDLAVCYPTWGLVVPSQRNDEIRRGLCRAWNRYTADVYDGFGDRLVPVATIPTATPQEAVDELDHAVVDLGFKVVMLGGFAVRDLDGGGTWIDSLGLDSAYDYDPLWQRLVELGVVAGFHSGSMGWSGRRSITNFSYNHMGNFAGASEATLKSLLFGGVLHRFPDLRLNFLEGGTTWAVQLVHDMIGHYHKRGPEGLPAYDPDAFEPDRFDKLLAEHAGRLNPEPGFGAQFADFFRTPDVVNDFEAAGITGPDDVIRQISTTCWFGCEADDPLTRLAFDPELPGGVPLNAVFSSDIAHWDVANMVDVMPEAYEQVENGWLDKEQFRAFMCDNAVRLCTGADPSFFKGTILEDYQPA